MLEEFRTRICNLDQNQYKEDCETAYIAGGFMRAHVGMCERERERGREIWENHLYQIIGDGLELIEILEALKLHSPLF